MRFLVDECTGPAVAAWLRVQSHEVFSVYDEARGMADEDVLAKAYSESWILITNDKDFGELVFRARKPHRGVIFLRLQDERAASKTEAMGKHRMRTSCRTHSSSSPKAQIRFAVT